jgi:hypothetical protein
MSLREKFTNWDIKNLPNPEEYDKNDNKYIEKFNNAFLSAVNFVILHEISHVVLGHIDLDNLDISQSVEEKKIHELDSDKFAIESLLMSTFNKSNIHIHRAGIISALLSIVMLDNTMKGDTHPDPDKRIEQALKIINVHENDPLWGVACMGFKQWSRYYNLPLEWPESTCSYKELFYETLEQLNFYLK